MVFEYIPTRRRDPTDQIRWRESEQDQVEMILMFHEVKKFRQVKKK